MSSYKTATSRHSIPDFSVTQIYHFSSIDTSLPPTNLQQPVPIFRRFYYLCRPACQTQRHSRQLRATFLLTTHKPIHHVQRTSKRTIGCSSEQHGRTFRILYHERRARPVPLLQIRPRRKYRRQHLFSFLCRHLYSQPCRRNHSRQIPELQRHNQDRSHNNGLRLCPAFNPYPCDLNQHQLAPAAHLPCTFPHCVRKRTLQGKPSGNRGTDVRQLGG